MPTIRRASTAVAAAIVAVAGLVACGDDDADTERHEGQDDEGRGHGLGSSSFSLRLKPERANGAAVPGDYAVRPSPSGSIRRWAWMMKKRIRALSTVAWARAFQALRASA